MWLAGWRLYGSDGMRVSEKGDVHRGEVLKLIHGFRLDSGWGRDAAWESYGAANGITYFGVAEGLLEGAAGRFRMWF